MTTDKISQNIVKIPRQIAVGIPTFLATNIFTIILNIHSYRVIGAYTFLCVLYYFIIYTGYGMRRTLYVALLLFTLTLNIAVVTEASTISDIIFASFGVFCLMTSCFYLFSKTAKAWFVARPLNLRRAREEKSSKYTEADLKNFIEIQKNIPPSYLWGRWMFFFIVVFDFFVIYSVFWKNGSSGLLWPLVNLVFDIIALIGLIKISEKFLNIYAGYLYACLILFGFGLLSFFCLVLFSKLSISGLFYEKLIMGGLMTTIFFGLKCIVFYNKKSRLWLKANYVMRGTPHS